MCLLGCKAESVDSMLLLQDHFFQVAASYFLVKPSPTVFRDLVITFLVRKSLRKKESVYVVISDSGWIQFQDGVSILLPSISAGGI